MEEQAKVATPTVADEFKVKLEALLSEYPTIRLTINQQILITEIAPTNG